MVDHDYFIGYSRYYAIIHEFSQMKQDKHNDLMCENDS